jgi:hypothetical protein
MRPETKEEIDFRSDIATQFGYKPKNKLPIRVILWRVLQGIAAWIITVGVFALMFAVLYLGYLLVLQWLGKNWGGLL